MAAPHHIYIDALRIRCVEQRFLDLFRQGVLNGTVHTCVGQEMAAMAVAGQLQSDDTIFSNHRCHGHFMAFTKNTAGLIWELMGRKAGVCGGIGSSQHLCYQNFYSNGIQGGIVPNAAGVALAHKLRNNQQIAVVCIGDGTLGEGVVYETMNIAAKWQLPLLIVCENNRYAQSTPITHNLSGEILARPEAFGIRTWHSDTWRVDHLMTTAATAIAEVRESRQPGFLLIDTYRLNAHSKGDDNRDEAEVQSYAEKDPLRVFQREHQAIYDAALAEIAQEIDAIVAQGDALPELELSAYHTPASVESSPVWSPVNVAPRQTRLVQDLNQFFLQQFAADPNAVFIGEDVLWPYGGAFKVSGELSAKYPDRVLSSPISEAAIVGIGNGLALAGMKPYIEIMFGDFTGIAFDQIANHAAKFHHMYNKQVTCPVVVRTPMGGGRGYGPTHSQSLEKHFAGIETLTIVAPNILAPLDVVYCAIHSARHPVLVIENKLDYGRRRLEGVPRGWEVLQDQSHYPVMRVAPAFDKPQVTLVTYGGSVSPTLEAITAALQEEEIVAEVIVLTQIAPVPLSAIRESVANTGALVVVEEGIEAFGIGAEILAAIAESTRAPIRCRRVGALPVPVPSCKGLERAVLPSPTRIVRAMVEVL